MNVEGLQKTFQGFLTDANPKRVDKACTELAGWLSYVIEKHNYFDLIPSKGGMKKHITLAGWSHVDKILGIGSHTTSLERIEVPIPPKRKLPIMGVEYHATCEIRSRHGIVLCTQVGVASNVSVNSKRNTHELEHSQIASLAGSRAMSKAHRILFADILLMTEYESIGSEEAVEVEYTKEKADENEEILNNNNAKSTEIPKEPAKKDEGDSPQKELYKKLERFIKSFVSKKGEPPTFLELKLLVAESGLSQKDKEAFGILCESKTIEKVFKKQLKSTLF